MTETDTKSKSVNKSDLKHVARVLMGTLLLQAVFFYISPAISELCTMLVCLISGIGVDNDTELLVLNIFDLIMYCLTFIIPALLYISLRWGKIRDYTHFRARVPEHPASAVLISLGIITLAGYVSDIVVSTFDVFGVGIYTSDSEFPVGIAAVIIYFTASVIAPAFIEEFVYRGVVLNALLPYGRCFAVVTSGVLFGVMHFNPSQLIYATIAGCVLAYFVSGSGSIWIGVGIHMLNNALSFLSFFIYDRFSYDIYYYYATMRDAVIVIAAVIAIIIALNRFAGAPDPRKSPPQTRKAEFVAFINPASILYAVAAVYLTLRWLYLY